MVKNGGKKKHLCMTILKVWQLTLYFGKTRPPWGGQLYKKNAFLTLFWWENMISDMSSGF